MNSGPERATFGESQVERRQPRGLDVTTTLRDFSIVTFAIPPERLRPHIHPRFMPELIDDDGRERALISAVCFRDTDFQLAGYPSPRLAFGQVNYRAYVRDTVTGKRAAWFFGTALDSATVIVPRHLWKLPWHRARIAFDCRFDEAGKRYAQYAMTATGSWGSASLRIEDSGQPASALPGFADLETGLVVLTHPMGGVYVRRDGALGSYAIWHERLALTVGRCSTAKFAVFRDLGLASYDEQQLPHSVLLQAQTDFTIYLPPRRVR